MNLKLGALPPVAKPRVTLTPFLTGASSTYKPKSANWLDKVDPDAWGMLGNDEYGDCAWAGMAHLLQANARYGDNVDLRFDNTGVLSAYSGCTGFDASDPSTDQGTVLQDALSYMLHHGMKDASGNLHKIRAFAQVDVSNPDEVEVAHDLFGGTYNGFSVYQFAMEEFQDGKSWTEHSKNRGALEGGHCVPTMKVAHSSHSRTCVTWGRPQWISNAFWTHYFSEAWVIVTDEWIEANGKTPSGLDLTGLLDESKRLMAA